MTASPGDTGSEETTFSGLSHGAECVFTFSGEVNLPRCMNGTECVFTFPGEANLPRRTNLSRGGTAREGLSVSVSFRKGLLSRILELPASKS